MRRASVASERPRPMTLEEWAALDPQLRSLEVYELGRHGRHTVAVSAAGGRVRLPGCPGLVLDLGALWDEVDRAERAHARTTRRR